MLGVAMLPRWASHVSADAAKRSTSWRCRFGRWVTIGNGMLGNGELADGVPVGSLALVWVSCGLGTAGRPPCRWRSASANLVGHRGKRRALTGLQTGLCGGSSVTGWCRLLCGGVGPRGDVIAECIWKHALRCRLIG